MKQITREMIEEFKIKQLKYDFAGYTFNKPEQLSFHHLIVPHKDCKAMGLGEGYLRWNGAILRQNTSHDYIHIINNIDPEIFQRITDIMVAENECGRIDKEHLRQIRDLLLYFEREHCTDRNKKGYPVIREAYVRERIRL